MKIASETSQFFFRILPVVDPRVGRGPASGPAQAGACRRADGRIGWQPSSLPQRRSGSPGRRLSGYTRSRDDHPVADSGTPASQRAPDGPATDREPFSITGYGPTPTNGSASVVSLDGAGRLRRAGAALAASWAAAVASIFVPVAHFLLVPGFLVIGIVSFVVRFRTPKRAVSVRGTCPDCGTDQEFDTSGPWSLPRQLTCGSCHRSLTATSKSLPPI